MDKIKVLEQKVDKLTSYVDLLVKENKTKELEINRLKSITEAINIILLRERLIRKPKKRLMPVRGIGLIHTKRGGYKETFPYAMNSSVIKELVERTKYQNSKTTINDLTSSLNENRLLSFDELCTVCNILAKRTQKLDDELSNLKKETLK